MIILYFKNFFKLVPIHMWILCAFTPILLVFISENVLVAAVHVYVMHNNSLKHQVTSNHFLLSDFFTFFFLFSVKFPFSAGRQASKVSCRSKVPVLKNI